MNAIWAVESIDYLLCSVHLSALLSAAGVVGHVPEVCAVKYVKVILGLWDWGPQNIITAGVYEGFKN